MHCSKISTEMNIIIIFDCIHHQCRETYPKYIAVSKQIDGSGELHYFFPKFLTVQKIYYQGCTMENKAFTVGLAKYLATTGLTK